MMNIGYEFKNKKLLDTALTHISYANERSAESNQRLEFLGDSVLSCVIATKLYELYPKFDEGVLTKIRAALVCEKSLAELAISMDLGNGIRFGRSEAMSDGVHKDSILADTFESVLGAIYLDSSYQTAEAWALKLFDEKLREVKNFRERNFKSELQIHFQKRDKNNEVVGYRLKSRTGPDHNPEFTAEAVYKGVIIGEGKGKNRKTAEQNAAKAAIERLRQKNAKI